MLEKLKEKAIVTKTENGAIAYSSSMDECLDLFSAIGGMRHSEENDIIKHFVRAYVSEPDIAMKILFYTRDIVVRQIK